MPPRHLRHFLSCAILATRLAVAHDNIPLDPPQLNPPDSLQFGPVEHTTWLDNFWKHSILRFFAPVLPWTASDTPSELAAEALKPRPISVSPNCAVEPLPLLEDVSAIALEEQSGLDSAVDFDGLTPTTATALERFREIVLSAGGLVSITSAYRPSEYQEHLQAVWDKWMRQLRYNRRADCRALRDQVREEFVRHELLARQRPALNSDHTLGIGFDASVSLPRTRSKRRRMTIDRLAREAGVSRPVPRRDPVHFRLISGRV